MKTLLLSIVLLSGFTQFASAQCRPFVKNNCKDALSGYIPNENFNAAKLMPGDIAEAQMTFYAGTDYRLLVCTQFMLGQASFQVTDLDGNEIYNNTNDHSDHFDFRVSGTQELIINLQIPAQKDVQINPQGCVAILVGIKVEAN